MKTLITKKIADRLEELAVKWKDHTSQAEALMMAAKEVMTFEDQEKEQIIQSHIEGQSFYSCQSEKAEQYYEQTYGGKK